MLNNYLNPKQNQLLYMLPAEDYERIVPHLELVELLLGEALKESGENLRYVYFPVDCIISMLYLLENGSSAEIAMIGFDGAVGISLFMSDKSLPYRGVVQTKGYAYRIKKKYFMQEFDRHKGLLIVMMKYTQLLLTQMALIAVCNRHHSIIQQLCRWLLLNLDRLHTNELVITQELIAGLLGVRREGITEAATKLQREGLIQYKRGHINVLDRAGLEYRVCECYQVIKEESERLLEIPERKKAVKNQVPLKPIRYPTTEERNGYFFLKKNIKQ